MSKGVKKQSLIIPGPAGQLEAMVELPEGAATDTVAVLCHPHPLYQGSMHNKVVHTLARACNDLELPALRFNFRGVGASAGEHANGVGEVEDLKAVIAWVREQHPGCEIVLGGFSFGSLIALQVACELAPVALLVIAPPVNRLGELIDAQLVPPEGFENLPLLVVQGDDDDVVNPDDVADWVSSVNPPPDFERFADTGHFFHGKLVPLREALVRFLTRTLKS